MSDVVIPIVFPEYRVTVAVPAASFDLFPFIDFDNFKTPAYKDKFSDLGHAGVLFINGSTGLTKYYEYGRYDSAGLGLVRKIAGLPDVRVAKGEIVLSSMKNTLRHISQKSGQSGKIKAAVIQVPGKFASMLTYAEQRKKQNGIPNRKAYDLFLNSCIHFVKSVAMAAGVDTPWLFDPRPNSYIGEFRDDFSDLDYSITSNVLAIEGQGKF